MSSNRARMIKETGKKLLSTSGKLMPNLNAKMLFFARTHEWPNLKNPETFNEKTTWLKLNNYNNNELVSKCADKYSVRDYVKAKGVGRQSSQLGKDRMDLALDIIGESAKGMDKFEITYYWGPQGQDLCNEEYIKKIAECGFTSVPIESWDPATNKIALGYLRKYGLTCSALSDYRIQNALAISDQTAIDTYVREVVVEYKDYLDVIKVSYCQLKSVDVKLGLGACDLGL